jgi:glycosyltransferase involved in cell wall biosynthesis
LTPPAEGLVSVVIPVRDAGRLLLDALRSVARQTYRRFEVLLVDDASSDRPRRLLARAGLPRARYFRLARRGGGGAARNVGLRHALGEWVAFLDADDTWVPRKLALQLAAARRTKAEFVYADVDALFEDGRRVRRFQAAYRARDWMWDYLRRFYENPVRTSTVLARRDLLAEAKGFDPRLGYFDDSDLCLRLALLREKRRGWKTFLPASLGLYRFHPGQWAWETGPRRGLELAAFRRRWDWLLTDRRPRY